MADRGGINLNITHNIESLKGLQDNTTSDLRSRIDGLEGKISTLAKAVIDSVKGNEALISQLKTIPQAAQAIAVAASSINEGVNKNNPGSRREAFYQQHAELTTAKYDTLSSDWKSGNMNKQERQLKGFYDVVKANTDIGGKFNSASNEAVSSLNKLNVGLSKLGKSSFGGIVGLNSFNIAEGLISNSMMAASRYYTLGAAYDVNLQGTPANQLGQLTTNKDIAQRNAVAGGIQTALPAAGLAIGSTIGGPIGAALGGAIGYAASIPVSMMTSSMNAQEQQKLNIQQLGNQIAMGSGESGQSATVNPTASVWDKVGFYAMQTMHHPFKSSFATSAEAQSSDYGLSYSVADPQLASYMNAKQGYAASTYAALKPSSTLYGASKDNVNTFATKIADIAQKSGIDLSSTASALSFMNSITSDGSFANTFGNSIAEFGGFGNISTGLQNAMTLTQMSPMNATQAVNYEETLAPYGQNYMNAGTSIQTMGGINKLQAGMILDAFYPGHTLKGLTNNPAELSKFLNGGTNLAAGISSLAGDKVGINQILAQSIFSTGTEQALQYAKTGSNESPHNTSNSGGNLPDTTNKAIQDLNSQIQSMNKGNKNQSSANMNVNAANVNLTVSSTLIHDLITLPSKLSTSQTHNSISGAH